VCSSDLDENRDYVHIDVTSGTGIVYGNGNYGPFDPLDYYGVGDVTKDVDGQWSHRVVIGHVTCVPNRIFDYKVTSSLGPSSASSAEYTATGKKFCLSY